MRLGEGEFGERPAAAAGGHGARRARLRAVRRPRARARRRPLRRPSPRRPRARRATRRDFVRLCARRPDWTCTSSPAGRRRGSSTSASSAACTWRRARAGRSTSAAAAPRSPSATRGGADVVESISLGAIRLTAEGPPPDADGRVLGRRLRDHAAPRAPDARSTPLRDVGRPEAAAYGTSGTIVNLAGVAARLLHERTPERDEPLTRKDLRAVAKRLRAHDRRRAARRAGARPRRGPTSSSPAPPSSTPLMEDLGIETITALDDCGLREGLLLDDLARAGQHELEHGAGVRERSVLQLARATSFDERARAPGRARSRSSSSTAPRAARPAPPRRRGARAAASTPRCSTTSARSSATRATTSTPTTSSATPTSSGFDQEEIAIMAATAYFHRKALPRAPVRGLLGARPAARARWCGG